MKNTATRTRAIENVHVLIDTKSKWHATPVDDATFDAIVDEHPYIPLCYHWVHIDKDKLGNGAQSKAIADKYPRWVHGPVRELVAGIVRREIEHARYALRIGEKDALGFDITEESRIRHYTERQPEPWATEIAERQLREERRKDVLETAQAERWTDQRHGGKPRKERPVGYVDFDGNKHRVGDTCPGSDNAMYFGDEGYDRCLKCGRVVRVRKDGTVARHTIPSTLRNPA